MSRPSSLKLNIVANFGAQIYVMGIGFVMAPIYFNYMGAESFGLIGFFTMMTACFMLLDAGLTPTLVRETARFQGGAISVEELRTFLRAIEVVFGVIAFVGATVMFFLAPVIAAKWLHVQRMPIEEVTQSLALMGLAMPLRWVSGLYRGIVNGFERQVVLGGYNVLIATLRFVGVLIIFWTLGATAVNFFAYQLAVALVELGGLMAMSYHLLPRGTGARGTFSWKPLLGNLVFSLTIAFTATVWVTVMQTDKVILSKVLSLGSYGIFSIAVVAAGAINAINAPFNQALLPRLTKLISEKNEIAMARLYGNATQAVCTVMAPAVAVLCFFAEPTLRAWTGNPSVAQHATTILILYAIGNGGVSLHSFAYYIQYAKGDLRLHFIGHALLLVLLVPLFFLGANRYGAVGTGAAWASVNMLYAFCWVPLIHARVFKGQHWRWMRHDVVPIIAPTFLAGWLLHVVVPHTVDRGTTFAVVIAVGVVLLAVAAAGSSMVRAKFFAILTDKRAAMLRV